MKLRTWCWVQRILVDLSNLLKCYTFERHQWLAWGSKYVTGSCVVHAIRKLETFLLPSQDDPMYIISFKKAFGSCLNCNIAIPHMLTTCSTVDPRFDRMKCLNDNDRDKINRRLINAMTANLASSSTDGIEAAPARISHTEVSILVV